MAKLKVCQKCGSTMDSSAKACPQCGALAKGKTGCIIGGVIAAVILIPLIANSSNSDSDTKTTDTSSAVVSTVSVAEENSTVAESVSEDKASSEAAEENQAQAKEESKAESKGEVKEESKEEVKEEVPNNVYKVGETLETGKVKITFQSVEDYISDNMFIEPDEGNKYIRAYFVVENTGNTDTLVSSYDFDCYADDSVADSPLLTDKMLSSTTLSPGRKAEGYVYYEVPQNAQKIEIEYETSYWTQKKVIFVVK